MTMTANVKATDSLLRFAMRADGVGTALAGLALMAAAVPLSGHTGISTTAVGTQKSFIKRSRFDKEWKKRSTKS